MVIKKNGLTRIVLVFNNFVIKIARYNYSYEHFLKSILANLTEYDVYTKHKDRTDLAKIYFKSPFGLFLVMERLNVENYEGKQEALFHLKEKYKDDEIKEVMCSDVKVDNFGFRDDNKGELVRLDYGGYWRNW
jgi:hypothetical protein